MKNQIEFVNQSEIQSEVKKYTFLKPTTRAKKN